MSTSLTIAVIGCGSFCSGFVPLFKAHPLVNKVYVCDLIQELADTAAQRFGVEVIASFEEALKRRDINAIAIFTQRHLHGPQVLAALAAGKHVYSAVPMASEVEQCQQIVELVRKSGLTYMMGETCYYYPSAMFCRETYRAGIFGKFVYGEAQYHHDISHFSQKFRSDLSSAGIPPFYYPTHSTAMLLSAVDSYALKVVAFGYEDREDDQFFKKGVNQWDNVFSNSFSMMKLANGGTARINECRRIGYKAPSSYVSSCYGTEGGYQFNNAQHLLTVKTPKGVTLTDVSERVNPAAMTENRHDPEFKQKVANHQWQWNSFAPIQQAEADRLPASFKAPDMPNGHMASHQLLVDDFCTAAAFGTLPPVNAWEAARWTIPGLIAHQSVLRDGEVLAVPDCGDAPKA
ncbi:MAG: Gfo/Idh/MocA family oxidoreductase [Lentisphaerae bacterium]|jgi:predicted dehydrogenase|nr:Gfo/Idh/MocA family oxidoreductase [Lentisphaerota bacterium]